MDDYTVMFIIQIVCLAVVFTLLYFIIASGESAKSELENIESSGSKDI